MLGGIEKLVDATRNQTGCLKTTVIMVGSAIAFICVILLLADIKCAYDIENWWAPLYPNGETVRVEYDLFRARALGETYLYMTTTDDAETAKQFYRDTRLGTLNAGKTRGLAWSESFVTPLEQAVAAAELHYNSLLTELEEELEEEPRRELAAEISSSKDWLENLLRLLDDGARSLITITSACGT